MQLEAQVIRYNVRTVRLVRNLVPVAILLTLATRYVGSYYAAAAAVLLQCALIYMFVRSRSRLGNQRIVIEGDRLSLPDSSTAIRGRATLGWTLSEQLVRVYGREHSYRLAVTQGDIQELKAALTQALGPVTVTRRRGSPRARFVAFAACIVGLVTLGVGILFELLVLALIGIAAAILGGATFGALSQRIAR